MPYIAHRRVKGKTYRYLVESYRDDLGSPRQRNLKYLGAAPGLAQDALSAVVLFAGGGGVEAGLVQAGIRPVVSVELDPTNPELSLLLADNNHLNFKPYGGKVVRQTVQELAENGFPNFPLSPDYLHASPVCSSFSAAKVDGREHKQDVEAAIAVAQAISILQPRCFTLENVPTYRKSRSWHLIEQSLKKEGYQLAAAVLDACDYGVAQSRKRFIVKAALGRQPGLPAKQKQVGWYEAIEDLIPQLPPSELLPAQQKALNEKLCSTPGIKALLIERIGYRDGNPQVKEPTEPVWTIKKSIFHDQKGSSRNRFIDVWLDSGEVRALTIEASARLQGFPRWYYLPSRVSVAGSILGYSVPPPLIAALVS
jgi:DNA (cytosine-5)-methyltransferase 1